MLKRRLPVLLSRRLLTRRFRRTFGSRSKVSFGLRHLLALPVQVDGVSATHGRFNDSFPTPFTSNSQSPSLGRERFTIAGGWTITTQWISSFIPTALKVRRC